MSNTQVTSITDATPKAAMPGPRAPRRSSSVSQILQAINADMMRGEFEWVDSDRVENTNYTIRVASDRETRLRAYRLAQRVYQSRGFVSDQSEFVSSPFDVHPDTLTVLAQDEEGRDAGTASLVIDSAAGLPCDEIYADEVSGLRSCSQGRRLGEMIRLAVSDEHRNSKMLLVRLFNFIYIFGRRLKGLDDCLIEVNPRHVNYYRRLLLFESFGPERPCPRVAGAPALLLRLNLDVSDEYMRLSRMNEAMPDRALYSHFYSWLEEGAVTEFLARSQIPMNEEDARYFGLEEALLRFGRLRSCREAARKNRAGLMSLA